MNELALLKIIREYLGDVKTMRGFQREYFRTRQAVSLTNSKTFEAKIDGRFLEVMQAVNDLVFIANEVQKNNEEM